VAIAYDKGLLTGQWHQLATIPGKMIEQLDCTDAGWMDLLSMAYLSLGDADSAIEAAEKGIAAKPHTLLSSALFHAYLAAGFID
jgi:hypothetical protein